MNNVEKIKVTDRSKLKTNAKRAVYDFDTITKILDDAFICHIGFALENQPFVIPTCYGRENDKIFFHGSAGSRMLKHIKTGSDICITVTMVDGIVLARSAFHHSINYRSVVIFGKAEEVTGLVEKTKALEIITEHIIPGRWKDVRRPNKKELNITTVFSMKFDEASAKVREGGPIDEKEDIDLNIWAGVLPLKVITQDPIRDSYLNENIPLPHYLLSYK
jgi:nitroimidazol reductase NimA-like FMN-containing flavoprotein (pyridoxamine 5'-phosphate oxidase superfamily)